MATASLEHRCSGQSACTPRRRHQPALIYWLLIFAFWFAASAPSAHAGETLIRATTFDQIFASRSSTLQIFDYSGRQPVFILDFPTLGEQGRTFNRIVALIEIMGLGARRVLDDDELAAFIRASGKTEYTFAYGNDFLVADLVIFFNLAEHRGIALNEEEKRLQAFLLDRGLMRERYGFLQAVRPNAVILSIPQEHQGDGEPSVDAAARRTILMHELAHAEYYSNPDYRRWCRRFWRELMNENQREAFRAFLARSGYDRENEELMINEAQAYLSFTPDTRAFSAKLLGLPEEEIEQLRQKFAAGAPSWPLRR